MPPVGQAEEAADATMTEAESDEAVATTAVTAEVAASEPPAAEKGVVAQPPVAGEEVAAQLAAQPPVAEEEVVTKPAAIEVVIAAPAAAVPAVAVDSAPVNEMEPAAGSEPLGEGQPPTPDLDFGSPSEALSESYELPPTAVRSSASAEVASLRALADAELSPAHPDTADVVDPSSISGRFFQRDEDSVPPLIDALGDRNDRDVEDDYIPGLHLSPDALARRARLRRIVAAVVGLAGVISLAVVGKAVISSRSSTSSGPQPSPAALQMPAEAAPQAQLRAVEASPAVAKAEPQAAPVPAEPVAKAEPAAPEPAKAEGEKAQPEPAKAEGNGEHGTPSQADAEKAEAPAAVAPADAGKLRREAEGFLNRGKYKEAIEAARGAIAADPTNAMAYLYLGSALQDTGKWKEGIAAYSDCVRNAKKGPVNECIAMGGHK